MNRADGMRLVRDARDLEGLKLSPQEEQTIPPPGSKTYVRVTGVKNTYANGYPGVLVYRDLSVNDPTSTGAWLDGEVVLVEEINNGTLTIARRYLCQGWGLKTFTDGDGDQLGWFVEVDKGEGGAAIKDGPWETRLTESTGPASGFLRAIDPLGDWADYSAVPDYTNSIYVCELDGALFAAKPTAKVLQWVDPDPENVGVYNAMPIQAADLVSGVYYAGFWNTADGQIFKGDKDLHGIWSCWNELNVRVSTDPTRDTPSWFAEVDTSGTPFGWMAISGDGPTTGVFPLLSGLSIQGEETAGGGSSAIAIGLHTYTLFYDFVGGAVGGSRYGGGTGGGYWQGFKWQGGSAGPFRIANGAVLGYAVTLQPGQITYSNGTTWTVLDAPGSDDKQYILRCINGVLSWFEGSCPPPMSGMANGPPTGPGEGDMSPSETETTPLPMAAEPEPPKLSYPPVNVRHCLYHLYPLNTANGLWRWNVEQLCRRMSLFNGQVIVAVAFDPPDGRKPDPTGTLGVNHYAKPGRADVSGECASFAQVYQAFGDHAKRVEFVEVENDPELCELASFDLLYGRLRNNRNDDEAIFYGHSKGITHKKGSVTKLWTDTMYKTYLDYWPVVQDVLSNHPVAGSFKVHGPGWDERNSRSQWHYSGSFLWVRTAPLFAKQWRKIDRFWSGIEPWPSLHFQDNEAGVIFHEAPVTRMALYKKSYWMDKVIPELVKWVDKNRTVPAELEELYAAAAQGPTNISEHLPTLRRYAEQVCSVVEFGVETGQSTLAFLAGLHGRGKLSSFDVVKTDEAATLAERFKDCFEFRVGSTVPGDIVPENYRGFIKDTPVVDIPECDLLFIDTIHEGWCLDSELERYHAKVSKFIVMHDTELYGDVGSDGKPGLRTSIGRFLSKHPEWVLVEEFKNNNGLTVLAKSNLDDPPDLKN